MVEEIINSYIKIIIIEPNFIIKNIIDNIEHKIFIEIITQILKEKEELKGQNNFGIKEENKEEVNNETNDEENNIKDILNDVIDNVLEIKEEKDKIKENNEINNQNNKINEVIKEQENDSSSEDNIKNIDSLLEIFMKKNKKIILS